MENKHLVPVLKAQVASTRPPFFGRGYARIVLLVVSRRRNKQTRVRVRALALVHLCHVHGCRPLLLSVWAEGDIQMDLLRQITPKPIGEGRCFGDFHVEKGRLRTSPACRGLGDGLGDGV